MAFVHTERVRFGDLDAMRHLNNVVFLRVGCQVREPGTLARIAFIRTLMPAHDPAHPEADRFGLIFAECHICPTPFATCSRARPERFNNRAAWKSDCVEFSQFDRQPAYTRGDDRRSVDDRRDGLRREADRAERMREMVAFAVAMCGGLAVLYLFFILIGTIDVGQAVAATVVAVILAAIWLFSFWLRMRSNASRLAQRTDRERRGF
jgi:hypothetical protein